MGGTWFKSIVGKRKVMCLWIPPSVDISKLTYLERAWDDNYSPESFKGLANPAQYIKDAGFSYAYAENRADMISAIAKVAGGNLMSCIFSTLVKGNSGPNQTKVLQQKLKDLGYYTGVVDGSFGDYTLKAVIAYQKAKGLVQDGIVGPVTAKSMGILCSGAKAAPVVTTSDIQKKIIAGTGKSFTTFTQFYEIVRTKCDYAYYFDGQYNAANAVAMIIKDINGAATGLNCVDYTQVGVKLAKEMGYQAVPYGIYCPGDGINHAIFQIKGKEFSSWTWIDLAAAASGGKALGLHWCSGAITKEPSWIPYE